jgi:predicted nucleic acid-binding protein
VIVVDASAITDLLLARGSADSIRAELVTHTELHVPEHFHVEVISAVRRRMLRREMDELRAARALSALIELRTLTYPALELIEQIWSLRAALTPYDAAYLALARRLDIGLITVDRGLATAAATEGRLVAVSG